MLMDFWTGKRITEIPFKQDFRGYMSRLTDAERAATKTEINARIAGDGICTSGWLPGADWQGSPFQALYDKAARCDPDAAARCFGLMVWEVMMERPEKWTSGRFEKDGVSGARQPAGAAGRGTTTDNTPGY